MAKPEITMMKTDALIPYARNPRTHSDSQVGQIAASIKEFGWLVPAVVDAENVLIAGHGRVLAAQKLGLDRVPTIDGSHLTPAQAKAFRIAENKLQLNAGWDDELLRVELEEMVAEDYGIDFTGFSEEEIADLLGTGGEGKTDPDDAPEIQKEAVSKPGDLWMLGLHRVLCGDATKAEDYERLMAGEKADMVFTDPPYNVDYGANKKNPKHRIRAIENDKQGPEEWESFCTQFFTILRDVSRGDLYVFGAPGPEGMRSRLILAGLGCHWSATIIWKKDRLVLTPANYQRIYEPCFYGWFGKSSYNGSRKETEVWDVKRPHKSDLHPTMKPVELIERAINNSSIVGQVVLDPFGGSGSTLIACEKLSRICRMMELAPNYVDVIVRRWQDFTGKEATLDGEEITFSQAAEAVAAS